MTPNYRLTVVNRDGSESDITSSVNERFLSLTVTDHLGDSGDTLELELDDVADAKGKFLELPKENTLFGVELGYREVPGTTPPYKGLKSLGTFRLDELEVRDDGQGRRITVTAHAVSTTYGYVKFPKTSLWRDLYLAEIVYAIAERNNLEPHVHSDFGEVRVTSADQTNEADSNFLQRLALNYNADVKVQKGRLYFCPREKFAEVALPDVIPAHITLALPGLGYSFTSAGRSNYTGVRALWQDKDKAVFGVATSYMTGHPEGEVWSQLNKTFFDEASAQAAADARKRMLDFTRARLNGSTLGNPEIMSGSSLTLKNARPSVPIEWRVIQAVHSLSDAGYVTQYTAEISKAESLDSGDEEETLPDGEGGDEDE